MKKTSVLVLASLLAIVALAVIPLVLIQDSEFGGADGQAEEVVAVVSPEYESWASNAIEPPGGETESLLFSLQAALGAGVFGFAMGYFVARKKDKSKTKDETKS